MNKRNRLNLIANLLLLVGIYVIFCMIPCAAVEVEIDKKAYKDIENEPSTEVETKKKEYLDSFLHQPILDIANHKYSYFDLKKTQSALGLNFDAREEVVIEFQVGDFILNYSNYDSLLTKAVDAAAQDAFSRDFWDLLVRKYYSYKPQKKLAACFLAHKIPEYEENMTDADLLAKLKVVFENEVQKNYEKISYKITKLNPFATINQIGFNRIKILMPGLKKQARKTMLITYVDKYFEKLYDANELLALGGPWEKLQELSKTMLDNNKSLTLNDLVDIRWSSSKPAVFRALVQAADTSAILHFLRSPQASALLPAELHFVLRAKPFRPLTAVFVPQRYELFALKKQNKRKFPQEEDIKSALAKPNPNGFDYLIDLTINKDAARKWAVLDNALIAFCMDDKLEETMYLSTLPSYSNSSIQIRGNYSEAGAKELCAKITWNLLLFRPKILKEVYSLPSPFKPYLTPFYLWIVALLFLVAAAGLLIFNYEGQWPLLGQLYKSFLFFGAVFSYGLVLLTPFYAGILFWLIFAAIEFSIGWFKTVQQQPASTNIAQGLRSFFKQDGYWYALGLLGTTGLFYYELGYLRASVLIAGLLLGLGLYLLLLLLQLKKIQH